MYNRHCIQTIKNKYTLLTSAEKRIADFILSEREAPLSLSAAELAKKASCAKSAVVRFCKSIGFSGYKEFRISLAFELSKNKQLNYTPYISPDEDAASILDKVFSSNIKTLHDTAEKIDKSTIQKLVDLLSEAKTIYIYGIGTSAALVNDFQYRLIQLGFTALCFTDITSMKISTMNITKNDAAIAISHSGRTIATVDALRLAREKGCRTACITSCPESPIVKESDFPIEIYSDEIDYPIEAISARIAHISVIDSIAISLSAKDYDSARQRNKKAHELINTVRY